MRQAACAVTGHRPSRFKFKYSEDYSLCKKIKRAMLEQFKRLYDEHGVRRYYVGGALGVDMWAGELILRLKEQPGYGDIELVVVLPFEGHDSKWDERSKRRMDFLLRMCSDCVIALSYNRLNFLAVHEKKLPAYLSSPVPERRFFENALRPTDRHIQRYS